MPFHSSFLLVNPGYHGHIYCLSSRRIGRQVDRSSVSQLIQHVSSLSSWPRSQRCLSQRCAHTPDHTTMLFCSGKLFINCFGQTEYCLHTAYKFCNRTQYPCAGILLRQATGFDGHPAASNSAMPCPGGRPALADRAPSMPEIATGLAPKGTVHCAYMISAVTVGAKCNSC